MDPPVHCTQLHCAFVSVRYPESNGSGVILALKRIRSASSQAWYLRCIRRNKFGQENWSSVKSWPNGSLASCFGTADWLAFRLAACTWVCLLSDRLALTPRWLALTCVDLRWLALTLVELKVVCKLTTFFTVWPPKAVDTSWSQVICICVNLRADSVANPFGHGFRKFWFCKLPLTCVDLRVRFSGQGPKPKQDGESGN